MDGRNFSLAALTHPVWRFVFSDYCSFSLRLHKENEPKEMRFAAVQIPAKIGALLLNGEKLDELHYVALIFGQFAVLHARSHRFLHASICKAAVD
jgi:hypothetical protein